VIGFLFKVLVFLFIKLPLLLLVGLIKLLVLPFQLLGLLFKGFALLMYARASRPSVISRSARSVLGAWMETPRRSEVAA
jgi:hypothetical protein